ncbi:MAG: hypothetical protein H7Z42_08600 [Roseiflexaceae bacterium]|nr:hypothetical protein [Roseiflexaceae bacterium]
MGKASRTKQARRETTEYVTSLTACEGTWLERLPDRDEQQRVAEARRELAKHRPIALELSADQEATNRFSLEVLRDQRFTPLHFEDWVIEQVIAAQGEPPVAESEDDPAFSDYLRAAVQSTANSRVRRALTSQAVRLVPGLVAEGNVRAALALEYNVYITLMSDAVTPLLAQMMVGGLARYYDNAEEE